MKLIAKGMIITAGLSLSQLSLAANTAQNLPASATPVGAIQQINIDRGLNTQHLTAAVKGSKGMAAPISGIGPGRFILQSVDLMGSDVPVPAAAVQLIASCQGKPIDFHGIQALAGQIEDAYRDEGWILNQVIIPPQRINPKSGKLQLKVINGHVSRVEVVGDSAKGARKQLQRYIEQIRAMNPFNFNEAERSLLQAGDIPGLTVTGTLRKDSSQPGASIMQIHVKRKAVQGLVNVNNRGSQYVGPNQVLVQVGVNDIFTADSLQVAGATAAPQSSELAYLNGSYTWIMGEKGAQVTVSGTYAQSTPGGSFKLLGLVGTLEQVELSVVQPVVRSLARNFSWLFNLYNTHNQSNFAVGQAYDDKITAAQAGFSYQQPLFSGNSQTQVLLTQGLPLNGASSNMPSRVGARQEFTKANIVTSYLRYLTQKVSYLLSGNAQYSQQALPVSEQLGYGGSQYGVAYQPSEFTGDKGVLGSASLRYDFDGNSLFQLVQPFVSYDIGKLWSNMGTVSTNGTANSGASLGFGVNATLKNNLQGTVMIAKPLTTSSSNNQAKDWVGFFNLSWLF